MVKSASKISIMVLQEKLAEAKSHLDVANVKYNELMKNHKLLSQKFMEVKMNLMHKEVSNL